MNRPVTRPLTPEHIAECICNLGVHFGLRNLLPSHTPKEFASTHVKSVAPRMLLPKASSGTSDSSSRTRSTGNQSERRKSSESRETRALDIRQMDQIDDEIVLSVAALMAREPRTCDCCGSDKHLIPSCPRLHAIAQDKTKTDRLKSTLDRILASGGGQSSPSNHRSAANDVRALTDEGQFDDATETDAEATIHSLTDDEDGHSAASADTDFR